MKEEIRKTLDSLGTSYVTESWTDGNNFYRIFSDGWCEQGGTLDTVNISTKQTVSLFKQYATDAYKITLQNIDVNTDDINLTAHAVESKTNTSFVSENARLSGSGTDTLKVDWMTFGML